MDKEPIIGEIQEQSLMPSMNVNIQPVERDVSNLISDDKLVRVYDEVMDNIRKDRDEIDNVLSTFVNMVINEGDATTSSKEALVNLMKMKSDQSDKMSKVIDLMTRLKLKDSFPKYMAANQTNNVTIKETVNRKSVLKQMAKDIKKEKNES